MKALTHTIVVALSLALAVPALAGTPAPAPDFVDRYIAREQAQAEPDFVDRWVAAHTPEILIGRLDSAQPAPSGDDAGTRTLVVALILSGAAVLVAALTVGVRRRVVARPL